MGALIWGTTHKIFCNLINYVAVHVLLSSCATQLAYGVVHRIARTKIFPPNFAFRNSLSSCKYKFPFEVCFWFGWLVSGASDGGVRGSLLLVDFRFSYPDQLGRATTQLIFFGESFFRASWYAPPRRSVSYGVPTKQKSVFFLWYRAALPSDPNSVPTLSANIMIVLCWYQSLNDPYVPAQSDTESGGSPPTAAQP